MGVLFILMLMGWSEQSTDHFIISYHSEDARAANSLIRIAEESYSEVTNRYGFSLEDKVKIYVLGDRAEVDRYYGDTAPSGIMGFAIPHQSTIYLISPRGTKSLPDTREVFMHELAHIFNHHISPRFPLWLNEGLAMWISGERRLRDNFWLSLAALTHSFLPLRDIENSFPAERRKTSLAYAESRNSVIYIVDVYGIDGLRKFLKELNSTQNVDEAIHNSFGFSYEEFDRNFLSFLRERYRWLSILGESFPLWSLLVILFLVAYMVKRHRTRRRLEILKREPDFFD